jgi:hypothetical protein
MVKVAMFSGIGIGGGLGLGVPARLKDDSREDERMWTCRTGPLMRAPVPARTAWMVSGAVSLSGLTRGGAVLLPVRE